MNEWGVVVVIISLIGLVTAIITPLLKLNTAITKLNVTIQTLNDNQRDYRTKLDQHESESIKKFEDHEHRLTEHTVKIKNLEHRVFRNNND